MSHQQRPAGAVIAVAACLAACAGPGGVPVELPQGVVVTRGVAHVTDGTLVWEQAGAGPAVVLLHGGQLDRRLWDDQLAPLSALHRVVRYDLRGYGHSSPPAGPFAHHDDLRELLDQLGLQRVHLVGLSLGGRVAVDFALEHPQRVASLALAGPALSGWQWSGDIWPSQLAEAVVARDKARIVEAWLASPLIAPAMEQPALAPRVRELVRDNAGSWLNPDVERRLEPPAVARLDELRVPLLLLLGGRDVPDIHAIVERLATSVPGARVTTFDAAGHLVNLEQPVAFNHQLLGWLAEVARR